MHRGAGVSSRTTCRLESGRIGGIGGKGQAQAEESLRHIRNLHYGCRPSDVGGPPARPACPAPYAKLCSRRADGDGTGDFGGTPN
eukprot:2536213-Pleurochrysis_carterae.AAC.2